MTQEFELPLIVYQCVSLGAVAWLKTKGIKPENYNPLAPDADEILFGLMLGDEPGSSK
ncbi:MAG: hypothetical protein HY747_09410 [Elusimicrobia bacterium]|nr:hypothetical protein [Elusimicrobiota bacterium]